MLYIWQVSEHISFMKRCLDLALEGLGAAEPNPLVGCVIVKDSEIVSEGYHKVYGGDHAEVMAIKNLPTSIDPADCQLYVSLEPCSHHGKTPPCADLIISKGFKEVIVGALDPNPLVSGKGLRKLKEADIEVIHGVMVSECRAINKKFFFFYENQRPYITLKWAQTKDHFMGRHVLDAHLGKQISSAASRTFVHKLRATHSAIAIGANTANMDNPRLTTRNYPGKDPLKVIISQRNSVEADLLLFKEGKTLVYNTLKEDQSEHYEYVLTKYRNFLEHVFNDLYDRGVQSILVEGGAMVLQSLIDHDLWNEAYCITGNVFWGSGVIAPKMTIDPASEFNLGEDTILHYKNS